MRNKRTSYDRVRQVSRSGKKDQEMDVEKPLDGPAYFSRTRPRDTGAFAVLRAIALELLGQVGEEQLRALFHVAGTRLAEDHALSKVARLADLESEARALLASQDWGWLRIEHREDAVDFVHGDSPLLAWFGEAGQAWSGALFEGLYATWIRQLGADTRLQLREIRNADSGSRELRFRLTHESRFKS
ncbi:MAG: cellulose biosynthesis protein BcsD [Panacagrimonas sp.]